MTKSISNYPHQFGGDFCFLKLTHYFILNDVENKNKNDMIIFTKDKKDLVVPSGLGNFVTIVQGGQSGVTEERVYEIVDSALTEYNPTDNFKTINGESLIGEGDIEIEGAIYTAGENIKISPDNEISLDTQDGIVVREIRSDVESPRIDFSMTKETPSGAYVQTERGEVFSEGYKVVNEEQLAIELRQFVPAENFATINGSGITDGGNIVIESGVKAIFFDKLSQAELVELYNELYAYRTVENTFDPSKYGFYYFINQDYCYGYHQFEIARLDSGRKIIFTAYLAGRDNDSKYRLYNARFTLNENGTISNYEIITVQNGWMLLGVNPETGVKESMSQSTNFSDWFGSDSRFQDAIIKVFYRHPTTNRYYFSQDVQMLSVEGEQRAFRAEVIYNGKRMLGTWTVSGNLLEWSEAEDIRVLPTPYPEAHILYPTKGMKAVFQGGRYTQRVTNGVIFDCSSLTAGNSVSGLLYPGDESGDIGLNISVGEEGMSVTWIERGVNENEWTHRSDRYLFYSGRTVLYYDATGYSIISGFEGIQYSTGNTFDVEMESDVKEWIYDGAQWVEQGEKIFYLKPERQWSPNAECYHWIREQMNAENEDAVRNAKYYVWQRVAIYEGWRQIYTWLPATFLYLRDDVEPLLTVSYDYEDDEQGDVHIKNTYWLRGDGYFDVDSTKKFSLTPVQ